MTPVIRTWQNTDLSEAITLFVNCYNFEPWQDKWTPERAGEYLTELTRFPGFRGFVAASDDQLLGLCLGHIRKWWRGDDYIIEEMCVSPELQRTGIGSRMLAEIRAMLMPDQIFNLILITETRSPSEQFYLRNGFSITTSMVLMTMEQNP